MLADVAEDPTLGTIGLLNPPVVAARYTAATRPGGFHQSVNDLAIPADAQRVYAVGSTHEPAARPPGHKGDSVGELVAYDRTGTTLTRRWAYRCDGGFRAIAVDPADGSLVALRQRYADGGATFTLMRFAVDAADPVRTADFAGQAAGLTLSADGAWAAVGEFGPRMWVFDRAFTRTATYDVGERFLAAPDLPAGPVLAGSRDGLRRVDPATGTVLASIPAHAEDLSMTPDGATAVFTGRPWRTVTEMVRGTYVQRELPITVVRPADLTVGRAIVVAGLMPARAVISPDGRTVVAEAKHVGSKRQSLIAVDVATGLELARRRLPPAAVTRFTPDGRTVAIGRSDDDGRVPVELWTVRP